MYGDYDDEYYDYEPRRGRPSIPKHFSYFQDETSENIESWSVFLNALHDHDHLKVFERYSKLKGHLAPYGSKMDGPPRQNKLNRKLAKIATRDFRLKHLLLHSWGLEQEEIATYLENPKIPTFLTPFDILLCHSFEMVQSLLKQRREKVWDESDRYRRQYQGLTFFNLETESVTLTPVVSTLHRSFENQDQGEFKDENDWPLMSGSKIKWAPNLEDRKAFFNMLVEGYLLAIEENGRITRDRNARIGSGHYYSTNQRKCFDYEASLKFSNGSSPMTIKESVVENVSSIIFKDSNPNERARQFLLGLFESPDLFKEVLKNWFVNGGENLPFQASDPVPHDLLFSSEVPDKALSDFLLKADDFVHSRNFRVGEQSFYDNQRLSPPEYTYEWRSFVTNSNTIKLNLIEIAFYKKRVGAALMALNSLEGRQKIGENIKLLFDTMEMVENRSRHLKNNDEVPVSVIRESFDLKMATAMSEDGNRDKPRRKI